jgi:hypothetical protein
MGGMDGTLRQTTQSMDKLGQTLESWQARVDDMIRMFVICCVGGI